MRVFNTRWGGDVSRTSNPRAYGRMMLIMSCILCLCVPVAIQGCGSRELSMPDEDADLSLEQMSSRDQMQAQIRVMMQQQQGLMEAKMEAGEQPGFINNPALNSWPGHNTEAYDPIIENDFKKTANEPLSTFSIDVDTASYANVRRYLNQSTPPPPGAVRIEEMINYFPYDYTPPPNLDTPFATNAEVVACPWKPEHRLARIGLKGWDMPREQRPPTSLTFLLDVSGSMNDEMKLPLVKQAMRMLVEQLGANDKVAIVVYAGASGLVLPPTSGLEKQTILNAIDNLQSGGSTNGGEGIQLAYSTATGSFIQGGVNRVILASDGDFNVGVTNQSELYNLIEERAKTGVFLTILGFGMGNLKDNTLEMLADKGNGNYGYVDSINEARKVFVEQMMGTLVTIAKDVKIQIEFNPATVGSYRLIGYENRILAAQDFNDDKKDAGEIGAGHTVTALYEIIPMGLPVDGAPSVDPLRYQQPPQLSAQAQSGEMFILRLRYKSPDGDESKLIEFTVKDSGYTFDQASPDTRFATAVAAFGMLLRHSKYAGSATLDTVSTWAEQGRGADPSGYRNEFIGLIPRARAVMRR